MKPLIVSNEELDLALQKLRNCSNKPVKRLAYYPAIVIDDKYRDIADKLGISFNGRIINNKPLSSLKGSEMKGVIELLQYFVETDHSTTFETQRHIVKYIGLSTLRFDSHVQQGRLLSLLQNLFVSTATTKNATFHFTMLINTYFHLAKHYKTKLNLRIYSLMDMIQDIIMAAHGINFVKDRSRYAELISDHRFKPSLRVDEAIELSKQQLQLVLYYLMKLLNTIIQLLDNFARRKLRPGFTSRRQKLQAFLILNKNIELLQLLKQCQL
ncbi:hypothetical protein KL905_001504 [Ogataea polymorpha]|nr:hypothetical protein KL937_002895 [Ogataea polymorpha]KAG7897097.1 hypothetical protein KL908_000499 [Ogataea polymorpha]KAG7903097.1 hypothetical protein KL935_000629 [Ogataea polymorpha]KAG7912297.1 hypothetical protein KL906_000501 [Ogataea polymorpha]KAG7919940.1 hypothetical protein KL927_000620 [Ogataea polymorpha]